MTRGELHRREKAVTSGFIEHNADKAYSYIQEIIDVNANGGVLFRFRPPLKREISALDESKIFLCRPSIYEDDGDCQIRFDVEDLCKYFMFEMKPEKYRKFAGLVNSDFYDAVMNKLKDNPRFINLKEKIRDQALVSCFTEQYSEKMWTEYAKDSEGICLMYNLHEMVINLPKELKFYPVRYVENRNCQKDIEFTSNEFNIGNDPDPAHLKFMLSCLTKDKIPYSSEAEWRLFFDIASLEKDEAGKLFDFKIKPRAVIMGRNIDRNIEFRENVEKYVAKHSIKLLKELDIK